MNQHSDNDFPLLTEIISDRARQVDLTQADVTHDFSKHSAAMPDLQQIEDALSERLFAELALQVPVLVEAALREHLPQAMGARLQAELLTALTNALPLAAQAASAELSAKVAYEVGGLLEQRLQDEVRRAVANEIATLTGQA